MTKFYRTTRWNADCIEVIEVERFNDISIWINGRRSNRKSNYDNFYETWAEARAVLVKAADQRLQGYRDAVERAIEGYDRAVNIPTTEPVIHTGEEGK